MRVINGIFFLFLAVCTKSRYSYIDFRLWGCLQTKSKYWWLYHEYKNVQESSFCSQNCYQARNVHTLWKKV